MLISNTNLQVTETSSLSGGTNSNFGAIRYMQNLGKDKRKCMSNKLIKNKNTLPEINEGVRVYNQIGYIVIFLGICSFALLGFVNLLPQDYEKYNIPLFFGVWAVISLILVIMGIIPLLLGKYSKKYRIWAEKDVESYQNWLLKKIQKSMEKDKKMKH